VLHIQFGELEAVHWTDVFASGPYCWEGVYGYILAFSQSESRLWKHITFAVDHLR